MRPHLFAGAFIGVFRGVLVQLRFDNVLGFAPGQSAVRNPTTSDLILRIRQRVLETDSLTEAADAMLLNRNDEGIKSIKVLELIGRVMFQ